MYYCYYLFVFVWLFVQQQEYELIKYKRGSCIETDNVFAWESFSQGTELCQDKTWAEFLMQW